MLYLQEKLIFIHKFNKKKKHMGLLDFFYKKPSKLALGDKKPKPQIPLNPSSLKGSNLDLDGQTPPKYVDNLPK